MMPGRKQTRPRAVFRLSLEVHERHTGRIEDAHMILCHMISYCFMEEAVAGRQCP